MDQLVEYITPQISFSYSCQVECTPSLNQAQENNTSKQGFLEIQLLFCRNKVQAGDTQTASRQDGRIGVIKDFRSPNCIRVALNTLLSSMDAPPCCFEYVTACVLDRASEVTESPASLFKLTANLVITMEENLDTEDEFTYDEVTEPLEQEENINMEDEFTYDNVSEPSENLDMEDEFNSDDDVAEPLEKEYRRMIRLQHQRGIVRSSRISAVHPIEY